MVVWAVRLGECQLLLLLQVREKRAVAVVLVDLMDASGSFLPRVRDLVGKNPVVLVGTKVNRLPP